METITEIINDEELIRIYEASYKLEFDTHFNNLKAEIEKARDQKYAVDLAIVSMAFIYGLRFSSDLEKEVSNTYEHYYKLSGTIADTIRAIPALIDKEQLDEEDWRKENKNKLKFKLKFKWGFVPIGYYFEMNPAIWMGSPFSSQQTLSDISDELGRQRAIVDFMGQLKVKYFSLVDEKGLTPMDKRPIPIETLNNLKRTLAQNDLDTFFKLWQGIFGTMSYNMKLTEGFFQSHIHMLLIILDIQILSEMDTNIGRIDSVIETENYIYILEFKKNDAKIAIEQVKRKKYYQRYFLSKKKIILVGIAVDTKERNIIDWTVQPLQL